MPRLLRRPRHLALVLASAIDDDACVSREGQELTTAVLTAFEGGLYAVARHSEAPQPVTAGADPRQRADCFAAAMTTPATPQITAMNSDTASPLPCSRLSV